MKERFIWFPFIWSGTAPATCGSAVYVTPFSMTFHSGAIWTENTEGGTVIARYEGTAHGTATLTTNAASAGTVYYGTAATGAGTVLHIPANGTLIIQGTAAAQTVVSGYAAFLVDEAGGTAYV